VTGFVVCCESQIKSGPYVEALKSAGVEGDEIIVVTPEDSHQHLALLGATASGLILCGGPDLEPWRYGQTPLADANLSLNPGLDQLEWELLTGAREAHTPVWAICRGMQTVNVFQGGTLWQDITTQIEGIINHDVPEPRDALAHEVRVVARDESFGRLLSIETVAVNSRHHQAVRHLGRNLTVVATSPDGLVEVLVLSAHEWWVKGVQWHPENLVHLTIQRRLWAEFVDAARHPLAQQGGLLNG
jgi:putative glutamine amidotransferase